MEAQTVDGQNIQRADLDPRLDPLPPISKLKKSFIEKINLPFGLFCPISRVLLNAPTLKWRGAGKTSVWKIRWFFCPFTVPCLGLSASKSVTAELSVV